jgi:16S rRNA (guanine966-N2)-methyltransferase
MRIISGTAGGIPLKVPAAVARPTVDRVREALFSMLGDAVTDARVLDVFAGSGALGLECLSRGAKSAIFVEQNGGACAVIEDNLKRSRLSGGRLLKGDAFATIKRLAQNGETFDLIFADPPYAKQKGDPDLGRELLKSPALLALLGNDGLFVLESMVTKHAEDVIAGWEIVRDREYGSTRIQILKPIKNDGESAGAADL